MKQWYALYVFLYSFGILGILISKYLRKAWSSYYQTSDCPHAMISIRISVCALMVTIWNAQSQPSNMMHLKKEAYGPWFGDSICVWFQSILPISIKVISSALGNQTISPVKPTCNNVTIHHVNFRERCFLHDRPWISSWIKSISSELDITIHVIVSQLSGLWRHQQLIVTSSTERELSE